MFHNHLLIGSIQHSQRKPTNALQPFTDVMYSINFVEVYKLLYTDQICEPKLGMIL